MGRSKNKRSTFFNKKSKVLNASIIHQLRHHCSSEIQSLMGINFKSYYHDSEDYFRAPQAEMILNLYSSEIATGVPRWSISVMIETYAWARRFDALSEKNVSLPTSVDPKAVALEKFRAAEAQCKSWNANVSNIYKSEPINGKGAAEIIHLVQRKIAYILKDTPELSDLRCSFGPGATTTCRKRTSAKWKLSSQLACTRDAVNSLTELSALYPRLNWKSIKLDEGSISFVPKNAKSARSICSEPVINAFVQRGLGKVMKRRLSRSGCNLYDQTNNRVLAQIASLNNELATVDLSNASDNISYRVVELLLPYQWFKLLATWRSDLAYLASNKEYFILQKFSAMGNGYTFELESSIFYACALVATDLAKESPELVSVYGDDIIVPSTAVTDLYAILNLFGFTVNTEKSFTEGPFRESCGGDYFLGNDVRPFYAKDVFTDARLVAYSNQIARSDYPCGKYRKLIESFVRDSNKFFGPDGYGDGHLIGYEWNKLQYRPKDGYEGYIFKTYTKCPKRDEAEPSGYAILPSYEAYLQETSEYIYSANKLNLVSPTYYQQFLDRTKEVDYARESDPHTLRGGEQARTIRVVVPPLSP